MTSKVKVNDNCPHCGEQIKGYMDIADSDNIKILNPTTILLPKEKPE